MYLFFQCPLLEFGNKINPNLNVNSRVNKTMRKMMRMKMNWKRCTGIQRRENPTPPRDLPNENNTNPKNQSMYLLTYRSPVYPTMDVPWALYITTISPTIVNHTALWTAIIRTTAMRETGRYHTMSMRMIRNYYKIISRMIGNNPTTNLCTIRNCFKIRTIRKVIPLLSTADFRVMILSGAQIIATSPIVIEEASLSHQLPIW